MKSHQIKLFDGFSILSLDELGGGGVFVANPTDDPTRYECQGKFFTAQELEKKFGRVAIVKTLDGQLIYTS